MTRTPAVAFLGAAHDGDLAPTDALLPRSRRTADVGHADDDLAAVYAGVGTTC